MGPEDGKGWTGTESRVCGWWCMLIVSISVWCPEDVRASSSVRAEYYQML